jgi:beta-galactosidase
VLSEAHAATIRTFVQKGGIFVTNFRLGVKSENSQIVKTPLPGLLRDVMGVTLEDYVPIYSAKQGVKFGSALSGPDGECSLWADILQPSTAEVLGTYTSGGYAGKAAIATNNFGKGKAIYIGADLDAASLARVLRSLMASAGIKPVLEVPGGVEVTLRRSDRKQWIFLLNHTDATQTVNIPSPCTDLLTGEWRTGTVTLNAYGVRVLQPS